LLDQLNNIYSFDYVEREYSPNWIKPLKYDNYFEFNGGKYILEMDGSFHKKDNTMSGQTKEQSKEIDDNKDLKAEEKGIKIIRIDCMESDIDYIKENILDSELNILFDLSLIDWFKCEEFALSNICKLSCGIKKNNPKMTATNISKMINMGKSTIIKYLKKGAKLGWCDYDPKEENLKAYKTNVERKSKCVEISKNNIFLGIFESTKELERQSNLLFGTKLSSSNISMVCLNKKETYKGFTFQYI